MFIPRVFYLRNELKLKDTIDLDTNEEHYLFNVLKHERKEKVEIHDKKDNIFTGIITSEHKIKITEKISKTVPDKYLILLQAVPKGKKINIIIEKGVELGIDRFLFFRGENSQSRLDTNKIKKIKTKILESVRQCRNPVIPEIEYSEKLSDILINDIKKKSGLFFYLDPSAAYRLDDLDIPENKRISFAAGPEKGFSEPEINLFKKLNIKGVKLGVNILRTETAALVITSILNNKIGIY